MQRALQQGVRTPIALVLTVQTCLLFFNAQGAFAVQSTLANTLPALAAEASRPAPNVLTLEQALSLAEKFSPMLAEANASVSRASAGVQTARAYRNPEVQFQAGSQSARPVQTPGVPGSLWHYSASQTLEVPRERRLRLRTSLLEVEGSQHRRNAIHLAAMADVKRAFFDVMMRKQQLAHAHANLDLVEDLRRRVRLEVEVGEKGKLELTRAEAELARAQAAVSNAGVELANARAILKAVVGLSAEEMIDADGNLHDAVELPSMADLRTEVLSKHPALAESNTLTARASAAVEHEKAKRIPEPTLMGEYERQPDISYYRFGISIPLPAWDKRKGPIAEAQAEVIRAESAARQRRLEIVAALERAWDQYQINNQQVNSLQAGSLREATAAVEAALSAYKFGERGIVEVLDAQRVLQGVRNDLLDARFARQSALIDLEELGVKLP